MKNYSNKEKAPKNTESSKMPKNFDPSKMPKGFDPSKMGGPQVGPDGKKIYRRTSSNGMGRGGFGGGPGRRGPGMGMKGPSMKKLDFTVIKRIMGYLFEYKWYMILAIACIVISAITSVYTAKALGILVDDYIAPMSASGVFNSANLMNYVWKMAAIYLISTVTAFVQERVFVVVTQSIIKRIRDDMFKHMQTLPIRYFDQNSYGDVMSRFTNDVETLQQLISRTLPQALSAVITLISSIVMMMANSVWLMLFMFVFVYILSKVTAWVASKSGRYFMAQQEALGSLNGFIEEMVDGQKVVKVFNHESAAIREFDEENNNLQDVAYNAGFYAGLMGPVMGGLGNVQYVIMAILGAALVALHVPNLKLTGIAPLTLGEVLIFLNLGRRFNMTISNIAQQMNSVVMAMAGANRVFDLLDSEPEMDEGTVTLVNVFEKVDGTLEECQKRTGIWAWKVPEEDGSFRYVRLQGDVRMKNVDFSYVEGKQILYDISLYAEPGQKVAFVGSTGAGKTTITNLINRFYDIQNGEITYDGIPIRQIKKADLRHSLGVVLQEVNLFTGSIKDNIRYGRLDATDEEIIAAAKLANAHDFITRLPQGYDTVIDGTGSQLSQGQRQLLSIARAALEDPPVMILDEATSSIDTRTEIIVQRGMDSLMKGRTVFVIAHRLSTVMNSDVIMVLEHGHIIEKGNHDQLIEKQGKYYQLYTGNNIQMDA